MKLRQIQAVYKYSNANRPKVTTSYDVSALTDSIYPDGVTYREEFKILALNGAGRLLGIATIGIGGLADVPADLRVIFQHLLLANAVAFILVHNHPSGSIKPSYADESLTKDVLAASRIMKIRLLDHVILTEDINKFYSFQDNGKL